MFGIGTGEFIVIILVAVLVLGPEHLPRIMRTVNKAMSEFRKVSTDLHRAMNAEVNLEEYEKEQKQAEAKKRKAAARARAKAKAEAEANEARANEARADEAGVEAGGAAEKANPYASAAGSAGTVIAENDAATGKEDANAS